MRYQVMAILLAVTAQPASAQTFTNRFELSDPQQIFGKGTSIRLDSSSARIGASGGLTTAANGIRSITFFAVDSAVTPNEMWRFIADETTDRVLSGTRQIGGQSLEAELQFLVGDLTPTVQQTCTGASGTFTVSTLNLGDGRIADLVGTFAMTCAERNASISGRIEFHDRATSPDDDGGGGRGGGGSLVIDWPTRTTAGGTTPLPPVEPEAPIAPQLNVTAVLDDVARPQFFTGETATVPVRVSMNDAFTGEVTLSAESDRSGLTFAFAPATTRASTVSVLTIGTSPAVAAGEHLVVVTAAGGGVVATTSFGVRVDCHPPMILGVDQPRSITIRSGDSAQIEVRVTGRGLFDFHWYEGQRGSTIVPVVNAHSAAFRTPPLVASTQYWVRVSNACGSVDSNAAVVTVEP